jgi:hypothetical protein
VNRRQRSEVALQQDTRGQTDLTEAPQLQGHTQIPASTSINFSSQVKAEQAKELDGADVLKRMREGTFPSTWLVLSPNIPVWFTLIVIFGITGFLASYFVIGLGLGFFVWSIVLGLADQLPFIHSYFVQMHINAYPVSIPDWLAWAAVIPGGIGALLGGRIAWDIPMSFDLVLLPGGLVCGRKEEDRASFVVNFHHVVAHVAAMWQRWRRYISRS